MTLQQFAIKAGVLICNTEPGFGGNFGYYEKEKPNIKTCGFQTEKAAYKHWLQSTFGNGAGKAVIKLLEESERKK